MVVPKTPVLFLPREPQRTFLPRPGQPEAGLYLSAASASWTRRLFSGLAWSLPSKPRSGGQWRPIFRRGLARTRLGALGDPSEWAAGEHQVDPPRIPTAAPRTAARQVGSGRFGADLDSIEVTSDGRRRIRYDFIDQIDRSKAFVRLDKDSKTHFDGKGKDFDRRDVCLQSGRVAVAEAWRGRGLADPGWVCPVGSASGPQGQYRCYLGNVDSGWAYGKEEGEITWRTAPVPAQRNTAVAFVAGSGYAPGKVEL